MFIKRPTSLQMIVDNIQDNTEADMVKSLQRIEIPRDRTKKNDLLTIENSITNLNYEIK